MSILNKLKDILHIEHHPSFTTRIVKMENDEYLVQIWDTDPLPLFYHHYWQNTAVRFDRYKEIRSSSLEIVLEEKKKLDELIKNKINGGKVKEVISG